MSHTPAAHKQLRILFVEDSLPDAELCLRELRKTGFKVTADIVQTPEEFDKHLSSNDYDLVLADYNLPHWTGIDALRQLQKEGKDIPFVLVTGTLGEETAVECIKQGATDYVLKDRLARLPVAVRRGLEEKAHRDERQHAAEALRESQRVLSTLMSNLPGMAYRCRNDPDWTMEFVSEGCFDLTGYHPSDLIHNQKVTYNQLIHPDDQAAIWDDVQAALRQQQPFQLVYRITTATGDERWVWEQGGGVFSSDGELLALEGFITDVTKHKRLEQETRARQRLEDILRFRSAFIANLSHELRTPLNSIVGFSEVLLDRIVGELNEKQAKFTNHILQAGRHLLALINDILDLSRAEAGRMELRPETFLLAEAVDATLALVKPQAAKKGISLRTRVAPNITTITADLVRFRQVIFNLIGNAVKFTPDGGRICVSACRVSSAELAVHRKTASPAIPSCITPGPGQGFIEISVEDTGIGIRTEDQEKLFQEFGQVGGEYAVQHHGAGLGLALTKKIVEIHGGRIWVHSAGEGKGSTFVFALPERERAETTLEVSSDETHEAPAVNKLSPGAFSPASRRRG